MATYQKRKNGYCAMVRVKGHRPMSKTFSLKADAKAWAEPIEADMRAGRWRGIAAVSLDHAMTVAEAIERFVKKGKQEQLIREKHQTINSRGIYNLDDSKRQRLEFMAKQDWAQYELGKLPPFELIEWRDERLEDRAPSTVKNDLNALSSVYRIARKEWQILGLVNPLDDVTRPSPGAPRNRRLEAGELEQILDACGKSIENQAIALKRVTIQRIIMIALLTGMRRSEIVYASAENMRGNVLHLPETKNNTARDVPISKEAKKYFPAVESGRYFPITPRSVTHSFKQACEVADINNLRFHDLRHEATSRFIEDGGFSPIEVAQIVGHKTLNQTMNYTHLRADRFAKKIDKMAPVLAA